MNIEIMVVPLKESVVVKFKFKRKTIGISVTQKTKTTLKIGVSLGIISLDTIRVMFAPLGHTPNSFDKHPRLVDIPAISVIGTTSPVIVNTTLETIIARSTLECSLEIVC